MSKTIRRKNRKTPDWELTDWTWLEGYHGRIPRSETEQAEARAKFHSDNGVGDKWPVPSWYKRMLNNEFREKARHEMQRLNTWKDWEEDDFDRMRHTAGYYW